MLQATLGRTGLTVNKDGFGVLPLQRRDMDTAVRILRAALAGGINFFDTARMYTDSEEKIGHALADQRGAFTLASKTTAKTPEEFWSDLATSLSLLQTSTIDIYQFHNPETCFKPGDGSGMYEAMLEAREQGKIRFIGLTNHRLPVAMEAAESKLYDTVQFPFNYLSSEKEEALVRLCEKNNIGFIAMKGLSGGLLQDISAARAHLAAYPGVVPIWGIQTDEELQKLLDATHAPATLSPAQLETIQKDKEELSGNFCRSCGYCLPCPADIEIFNCARMFLLLRRAPAGPYLSEEWQAKMAKVEDCIECGQCAQRCPYGLDTPNLLKYSYQDYKTFL